MGERETCVTHKAQTQMNLKKPNQTTQNTNLAVPENRWTLFPFCLKTWLYRNLASAFSSYLSQTQKSDCPLKDRVFLEMGYFSLHVFFTKQFSNLGIIKIYFF